MVMEPVRGAADGSVDGAADGSVEAPVDGAAEAGACVAPPPPHAAATIATAPTRDAKRSLVFTCADLLQGCSMTMIRSAVPAASGRVRPLVADAAMSRA